MNFNLENKKQFFIILLAAFLGIVAVVLTGNYIQNDINTQTRKLAQEYEKKALAAQRDVDGLKVELGKVMNEQRALVGKMEAMKQEKTKAVEVSTATPLKAPPGKRAITIMVDALSAVGGLVNPGDYVDVIAQLSVKDPKNAKDKTAAAEITSVLFQNIQVLAVNTNLKPALNQAIYDTFQKSRSLNITLAVDPEAAGLIAFAQSNGKLHLALRSNNDRETQPLQTASWETLSDYVYNSQGTELSLPTKEIEQEAAEEAKPFIQVFRGGQGL
jgi:pilus assembly protein CpaB